MQDRIYQGKHIGDIIDCQDKYRTFIGQMPTGGGKTVEFSLIAQEYVRRTGKSVMIVVHREELLYQAADVLRRITGIEPQLITQKTKEYRIARVYIAMVESLVRRLDVFSNIGMVIVDECHIANFNKIHDIFTDEIIIGWSATPISSSKHHPLKDYYEHIVVGPQISELIKLGYLSQNITRCPEGIIESTKLEINRLKGDYDDKKMAIEYKKPKFINNVIRSYNRFAKGQKTIVFNVNIDHSKEVNEHFCMYGFDSKHLDSKCSYEERREIFRWFRTTPGAILNSVMIPTVGFDEPTVECIILNFSTLSLPKFLQTCGRCSRIIDYELATELGVDVKTHFNIIDMGGNWVRFGDWSNDRDWEYVFNNPAKPGDGIAPVKTCPKCLGLIHASLRICPLKNEKDDFCNHEFEKQKIEEPEDLGEMIVITKGINLDEIIEKNSKKYDYYVFLKLAEPIVKNIYETFEKPSDATLQQGFDAYYKLCIDWYKETLAGKEGNIQDITHSAWHIRRAKNNYTDIVNKFKKTAFLKLQSHNNIKLVDGMIDMYQPR